jgi:hypothetical protein
MQVLFSLSQIIMSGLLLGIVLSVCACWFHSIVTLPPWFVTMSLVHVRTSVFGPVAPLFPCICWGVFAHSLYHAVLHIVLLPVLAMLILYDLLSHQIVGTVCICCPSLYVVFLWRIIIIIIIITTILNWPWTNVEMVAENIMYVYV